MAKQNASRAKRSASGARLVPTNLPGVYSFEPPKPGAIHPKSALKTLKRHGVPLRPSGNRSRRAAALWESLISRRLQHIHPHLEVLAVKKPPPRNVKRHKPSRSDETDSNSASASTNWSGGALASPARKLIAAYAEWVVPTVKRGPGDLDAQSPWKSSTWVGLDGWGISDDVLQAGTAQYVDIIDGQDTAHYYAWYEWFPFFEVRIDNFAVAPGDAIFAYVAFDGPDSLQVQYGHAWLVNLTSGIETSVYFPQPGPVDLPAGFLGNTAECIMEAPGFVMPDGAIGLHNFPHFGEVAFVNFGACSDNGAVFGPDDLTTIALTNQRSDGELRRAVVCKPV